MVQLDTIMQTRGMPAFWLGTGRCGHLHAAWLELPLRRGRLSPSDRLMVGQYLRTIGSADHRLTCRKPTCPTRSRLIALTITPRPTGSIKSPRPITYLLRW